MFNSCVVKKMSMDVWNWIWKIVLAVFAFLVVGSGFSFLITRYLNNRLPQPISSDNIFVYAGMGLGFVFTTVFIVVFFGGFVSIVIYYAIKNLIEGIKEWHENTVKSCSPKKIKVKK